MCSDKSVIPEYVSALKTSAMTFQYNCKIKNYDNSPIVFSSQLGGQ